jgi:hypothetical protein
MSSNALFAGNDSGLMPNRQLNHRQWNASHLDEKSLALIGNASGGASQPNPVRPRLP